MNTGMEINKSSRSVLKRFLIFRYRVIPVFPIFYSHSVLQNPRNDLSFSGQLCSAVYQRNQIHGRDDEQHRKIECSIVWHACLALLCHTRESIMTAVQATVVPWRRLVVVLHHQTAIIRGHQLQVRRTRAISKLTLFTESACLSNESAT